MLCTFTIDVGVLANDAWSSWILGQLGRISPTLVNYRILFCGQPLSACQSSLRFTLAADNTAVFKMLNGNLRRLAREDGAKVIVLKEFSDEELPSLKPLELLGYRKGDSLPTHLVLLKSSSFDDYLKDISSNKRHQKPAMLLS